MYEVPVGSRERDRHRNKGETQCKGCDGGPRLLTGDVRTQEAVLPVNKLEDASFKSRRRLTRSLIFPGNCWLELLSPVTHPFTFFRRLDDRRERKLSQSNQPDFSVNYHVCAISVFSLTHQRLLLPLLYCLFFSCACCPVVWHIYRLYSTTVTCHCTHL